jgi:tetratricopeptide (TPR) repeat protein
VLLLAVGLCLSASSAQAATIPHSEEVLPFGALLRDRLSLDEADPEELLAGAESQFAFFFPGGVSTPVTDRTQLDALVAATMLFEEGLRRGPVSYQQARSLFQCYMVMYSAGRSGMLARSFTALRREAEAQGASEELELLDVYIETLEAFEAHGLASARRLGEVLVAVRPEETEVAYAMAGLAEQAGDYEEAAHYYSVGVEAEFYAERLLALAELEGVSSEDRADAIVRRALEIEPSLEEEIESLEERIEIRRQLSGLERSYNRGRADADEKLELARLYRRVGRIGDALTVYQELARDSDPPEGYAEDYAIATMEANQPLLMLQIMEGTRDDSDTPSPRLLQLRLVAESVEVVTAAARGASGFRLEQYLESEDGAGMASDLSAFEAIDPERARFVRVYLELVTALVELRRTGELDTSWADAIRRQIDELVEAQSDNVAGHRFRLMLDLYRQDYGRLRDDLESYQRFCQDHDCVAEYLRVSSIMMLQLAAQGGDASLLSDVEDLLADWPEVERGPLYQLISGSVALVEVNLERGSGSARERARGRAREAFREAVVLRRQPGQTPQASAADYAALYNNLGYLALEERDYPAAKLYLGAARRYDASHPVLMMNLGVALANGQDYGDAFVTFSLGAAEALTDPGITFQLLRWAGHIYSLADREEEATSAYQRALSLYEAGGDWQERADDGIFPGGPVEWGLLYDEDEGLVVTLDLATPPMLYVPAPVGVLEMAATVE